MPGAVASLYLAEGRLPRPNKALDEGQGLERVADSLEGVQLALVWVLDDGLLHQPYIQQPVDIPLTGADLGTSGPLSS